MNVVADGELILSQYLLWTKVWWIPRFRPEWAVLGVGEKSSCVDYGGCSTSMTLTQDSWGGVRGEMCFSCGEVHQQSYPPKHYACSLGYGESCGYDAVIVFHRAGELTSLRLKNTDVAAWVFAFWTCRVCMLHLRCWINHQATLTFERYSVSVYFWESFWGELSLSHNTSNHVWWWCFLYTSVSEHQRANISIDRGI